MRGGEGASVDPANGRFFREIEALSRALQVEPKHQRRRGRPAPSSGHRSVSAGKTHTPLDADPKEKKPSLWNWRPLKALSHIRHRRFDCMFFLHVHTIENISPVLADASFCVHWRRTNADLVSSHTRPARVCRGVAEFNETLTCRCSVYGSRNGPQGSAKYEARHSLLYATVLGAPGIDLGKHRVDLTRLLPLNLEELEEGKSSGEWSTSFRLSGKASGGKLNVSFGFSMISGNAVGEKKILEVLNEKREKMNSIRRVGILQEMKIGSVDYVKAHEMDASPEVPGSGMMIQKIDGDAGANSILSKKDSPEMKKCCVLGEPCEPNVEEIQVPDFMVIERGIEIATSIRELGSEAVEGETNLKRDEGFLFDQETRVRMIQKDQNSTFHGTLTQEPEKFGFPEPTTDAFNKLSSYDAEPNQRAGSMKNRSRSLDDLTEEVAMEFLSMLDAEQTSEGLISDGDPESPREQLWKQFKKESFISEDGLLGFSIGADEEINCGRDSEGFDFHSVVHEISSVNEDIHQSMKGKLMNRTLEDVETEALLREWGLDEKVFDNSPTASQSGFGSPIHLLPGEPLELPPLGENLGPFVETKDGGFLRSMSPNLFKDSKNKGSLVMQFSKPVVMPAEMGSDVMEILQHLASIGVEKLSMQANKLMPLEDITGSSMQQLDWEASSVPQSFHSLDSKKFNNSRNKADMEADSNSEYVLLEDLAPLAMGKVEALSIEGLKVQSGMSEEDAPSQSFEEGKDANVFRSCCLEGAAGLQLLDVKDNGDTVDDLMGLSITLDEWTRLDMGIIDEEDELSDRTSKILSAHHAKSTEFSMGGRKGDKKGARSSARRWGLLENNFTVALMVQLRDPFRNYEPVGTPMLALIQVERVFVSPRPKIFSSVSDRGGKEQEDDSESDFEAVSKSEKEAALNEISQFKVTEVHVAGLKTEAARKWQWGNAIQEQSGSRWLLANGMGKNKNPFLKSSSSTKSSQLTAKARPEDSIWSISSRFNGGGSKWKESASSKSHARNPNIKFSR
ncbi:hypothetical protein AXF42_Ash005241 [Apostasia shenzhenica]|uniref:C2 NT-type domain-containing protein n=1 Tax=Apostasia shenzhenica TaxID=1088818 RepID=A0A2I0B6C4_9ASPA|nr:hypothetical protein AXF42_Ash005241 [Apostasia shenzhenica]